MDTPDDDLQDFFLHRKEDSINENNNSPQLEIHEYIK